MAHQNYFGFTPAAGQQYAPQPSAYAPPSATYVPAHGQTYAPAPRAGATQYSYDTGAHPAAYTYTPAPPGPAARAAVVTVAVTPQYQAVQVKPSYTSGYTTAARSVGNVVAPLAKAHGGPPNPSGYSYVANAAYSTPTPAVANQVPPPPPPPAQTPGIVSQAGTGGSSYDAALYTAATNYYQQKQQGVTNTGYTRKDNNFVGYNKKPISAGRGYSGINAFVKKRMPGAQQTHYCEVCKISCAGPQTYKEHLEGQKHKKKEAQAKAGNAAVNMKAGQSQLKCDLCDITCTGTDAYTAHIRGSKHQKTLNLHQRLGKPIPSSEPTIVTATDDKTTTETKSTKPLPIIKKVVATPGIKFVGGTTLQTLGGETKEVTTSRPTQAAAAPASTSTSEPVNNNSEDSQDELLLPGEKAIQPVGNEYVEENFDPTGKLVSFYCKLCDCKFSDPNAKNMHMKGRRHRTNYKKKVDPTLVVDMKPNPKFKRLQQDRIREKNVRDTLRRQRDEQMAVVSEIRMLESDRFFIEPRGYNETFSDRIETYNDRHIMARHNLIYPEEDELQAIQVIVTACEKALKLVSDSIHEQSDSPKKDDEGKEVRLLKGVMRVGDLAKGLILHDALNIELVVLCSEKPTRQLLDQLYKMVPEKLKEIGDEVELEVTKDEKNAAVVVINNTVPKATCSLTLTCPLFREDVNVPALAAETSTTTAAVTPVGTIPAAATSKPAEAEQSNKSAAELLDKQKCLAALAALRHSKWFQARAGIIPSCVPLLRVLKDLRKREEKFASLSMWSVELLLERCMSTAVSPMGPGDAMRRFFEALSSGLCLPGGPGLSDPCEKDPVDAFGNMNLQSREILTCYAQTCLRLIAFNQIHKILGIEPLPAGEQPVPLNRKRPFSASDEEATEVSTKKEVKEDQHPQS